ncbi:MAG: DNA-directed RNA polymerase subunit H [Candidatus Diapherotrites archaeon]|nr:DNA-directed RNA polymerase subunit H [Candidatus Diapherotrites archaeon]
MSFEPVRHFLVPEHFILPAEDVDRLLARLGTQAENLPQISKTDPAVKNLKPRKGDIIKIIRNSPTAGQAVYYRKVV